MKIDKYMMDIAKLTAKLSYCKRLNVGAVIARDGRPLVTGYNGTISGTNNCCEEPHTELQCSRCENREQNTLTINVNYCKKCNSKGYVEENITLNTSDFVVHAEQNAIFYSAKNGINTDGTSIYITHAPCPNCAKAIASAGIKRVVYEKEYRDDRGIKFLRDCGVSVILLN